MLKISLFDKKRVSDFTQAVFGNNCLNMDITDNERRDISYVCNYLNDEQKILEERKQYYIL